MSDGYKKFTVAALLALYGFVVAFGVFAIPWLRENDALVLLLPLAVVNFLLAFVVYTIATEDSL